MAYIFDTIYTFAFIIKYKIIFIGHFALSLNILHISFDMSGPEL